MKDLFVLTADADAQALLRALLARDKALAIRPIAFDVQRFVGRDSGMVKEGPEALRIMDRKSSYSKAVLIWDRDGSGWEKIPPPDAQQQIQSRLDGVTWAQRSASVVLVPELEEWLWYCDASVASLLNLPPRKVADLVEKCAAAMDCAVEHAKRRKPKELFEAVFYAVNRKRPLPDDFFFLGAKADLRMWTQSSSFKRLLDTLQFWFAEA